MFQRIAALSAIGLAAVGAAYAADQAQPAGTQVAKAAPAPQPPQTSPPPASAASGERLEKLNSNGPGQPLKVVVHHHVAAEDVHDGRVDIGGLRVSLPPTREITVVNADGTTTTRQTVVLPPPVWGEGVVVMPDNTYGPGEPMWIARERDQADLQLLKASADLASTDAIRARPYYNDYTYQRDILAENASFGRFDIGGLIGGWGGGGGGFGGWHGPQVNPLHAGLVGPVTTTVTTSDQLGATAQSQFSKAAYPRNNGVQDAHDAANRTFGNASLPRINDTQNAVDRAHSNANKEHPTPAPAR